MRAAQAKRGGDPRRRFRQPASFQEKTPEIFGFVQEAIKTEDAEAAGKWLAAQDRLTKHILNLGEELGITPKARRARGLSAPR